MQCPTGPAPYFVVFEGIDGSGKSTQIRLLHDRLMHSQISCKLTSEPTEGPIGKLIRKAFSGQFLTSQAVIAALFAADRLHHLMEPNQGIQDILKSGHWVLCDRYYLSSYAYHSVHVPLDWVIHCNQLSLELLKPDLTIFIDVPPELCFERISSKRTYLEMYESIENLKMVREKYYEAFDIISSNDRPVIIDGEKSIEDIHQMIWDLIHEKLLLPPIGH